VSRHISPATVTRPISPPTRLPLTVADVHRPTGAGVYNFVGGTSNNLSGMQLSTLDRFQRRRHSDPPLRRLLPHNPDGAEDRLC